MFTLIIKEQVYQTLDDAYWWYEQQVNGLGERLLKEVAVCFEKLESNPSYYSITKETYRKILVRHFPFKIIFEILDKEVVIYAMFHTSRKPDTIFG